MVQNETKIRMILGQHKRMATLLGGLYSPGMRFFPKDDLPGSKEDEVISEAEKEAQAKHEKELEVEKQKARQHEANAEKEKERARNAQAALDALKAQNEADKQKLAELQAKLEKQEDAEVPDLNPDDFDEPGEKTLVAAIKALTAKTKAQAKQLENLNKTKAELLKQQAEDRAAAKRTQQYNELLDDFDKDYGHEHRNAAVNAFNKLVAEGKVPNNAAKATRIMEKCYRDAVKAAKDKKKKGSDEVVLDPGRGGGDTTRLSRVKLTKGSLDEVAAQAEKLLVESSPP